MKLKSRKRKTRIKQEDRKGPAGEPLMQVSKNAEC